MAGDDTRRLSQLVSLLSDAAPHVSYIGGPEWLRQRLAERVYISGEWLDM